MSTAVGPLSFRQDQESFQKPFSEATAQLIDSEIQKLVRNAHARTTKLLTDKRKEAEMVAERLLEKEVLSRSDMIALIGKRPFESANADMVGDFGTAAPAGGPESLPGTGIEGGLAGGLGNNVPEPKGIEEQR